MLLEAGIGGGRPWSLLRCLVEDGILHLDILPYQVLVAAAPLIPDIGDVLGGGLVAIRDGRLLDFAPPGEVQRLVETPRNPRQFLFRE